MKPNRHLADPDEYDMSGIDLSAEGPDFKAFRVRTVIPASPAAEAGIRAGDVIVRIDGDPTTKLNLSQVQERFKQDGCERIVSIRRLGRTLRVKVKLKRLI